MAKRFSGELRMTLSSGHMGLTDEYDIRVKAPGSSPHEGVSALSEGYTEMHGEDASIDEAARQYLRFMSEYGDEDAAFSMVKKAAKDGKDFHVGCSKADRWAGGKSNTKTKKGR